LIDQILVIKPSETPDIIYSSLHILSIMPFARRYRMQLESSHTHY
jgi:hypothetical protein